VSSIDAAANVVTLGRRDDLYLREFELEKASFVCGAAPGDGFEAKVRIRHRAPLVRGVVRRDSAHGPDGGGRWRVELESAAWAPAPGQAAVFYDGDEVIGGGRIARSSSRV
jgi:tRNA-uridine 2-sulfurtransferase